VNRDLFRDASPMLWDTVRVVTRLLHPARDAGANIHLPDPTKRAHRRALMLRWIRDKAKRRKPYRDLVRLTE
jgi:ribosomal protein S7